MLNRSVPSRASRTKRATFARTCSVAMLVASCAAGAQAQRETPEPATTTERIPVFGNPHELRHKLTFLVNMARFTEWPAEAFAREDSPIVIGMVNPRPTPGQKRFPMADPPPPPQVVRLFDKYSIGGRSIHINVVNRIDEMRQCHVLYFPAPLDRKSVHVMKFLKDLPIVTVGEVEQFARLGGMIELTQQQRGPNPAFEVNMVAAQRSKIQFSSRMLSIAARVHRDTDR